MKVRFRHVQILLGLTILGVLFFSVDIAVLDFSSVNLFSTYGALCIATLILSLIPRALRWAALMNDDVTAHVSLGDSLRFLLIGSALNLVMPAGAGDVAKSYFGYRYTGIKERMLAVSVYDKLVAIASLSTLALVAFFNTRNWLFLLAALVSVGPWLLVETYPYFSRISLFIALEQWITERLKGKINFKLVMDQMRFKWWLKLQALAFSLVGWVLDYGLLYLCFLIMNLSLNPITMLINGPLLTLGRLFPFTLNGLGTDEALMVFLFSANDSVPKETVLMTAILYRIIISVTPALAGIFFIYAPVKSRN